MPKDHLKQIARAQGCLLGQLSGDSLGSLVEFQSPSQIHRRYPAGVRHLEDGGTWDTIAGQPTDDSEMAILLARMLVKNGSYDADSALKAYQWWLKSGPFDCGLTIGMGLQGRLNHDSQANGAMMRISPLGIFGAGRSSKELIDWAAQDAGLTHPHPICRQANILFVSAIAKAINQETSPDDLYHSIVLQAANLGVNAALMKVIHQAGHAPPADYTRQQGWVMIAFHNALWQLTHAPNLEEGVVNTVMRGGDTDTNAAICGALLGAVGGLHVLNAFGQWTHWS